MNDHQKHAARMQAACDAKAARLKLKHAVKSRSPEYILSTANASAAADDRLNAAALPSAPVTYSACWNGRSLPVTVEPAATLHTLIARAKAAHGLQYLSFQSPLSAIPGKWALRARKTHPAQFLEIAPEPNTATTPAATTNHDQPRPTPTKPRLVPPEAALKALHTAIALRHAPTIAARHEVDASREALFKTYGKQALAAYLVTPAPEPPDNAPPPEDPGPYEMTLPISATRNQIAAAALRLLSRVQWSRLDFMGENAAAITIAGGKLAATIKPDPDAYYDQEDEDDEPEQPDPLETDEHGNYIL